MSRILSRKLIIGVSVILVLAGSLFALLVWEAILLQSRGYGHIGRLSVPPHFLASLTLNRIENFCLKRYREFYKKTGSQVDYKWPDAKIIAANVPEVALVDNQPYAKFGIYILNSKKTKQTFLYSVNSQVTTSKLARMLEKLWNASKEQALVDPVTTCVMATREKPHGVYHPYEDYPLPLKEDIGFEAWKTWYFIMRDDGAALTYYVQSDIPPIPGCLAYIDQIEPQFSKFYYPEEILPIFKAIYPNANIPEEQILREGRDY